MKMALSYRYNPEWCSYNGLALSVKVSIYICGCACIIKKKRINIHTTYLNRTVRQLSLAMAVTLKNVVCKPLNPLGT